MYTAVFLDAEECGGPKKSEAWAGGSKKYRELVRFNGTHRTWASAKHRVHQSTGSHRCPRPGIGKVPIIAPKAILSNKNS